MLTAKEADEETGIGHLFPHFKLIKEINKIEEVLYEFNNCFPHLSEKTSDYAVYAEKL